MRRYISSRILLLGIGALLLVASPVKADPITGYFDVHILERISLSKELTEPFDTSFRLSVTFDDGIVIENSFGTILQQVYGPPVFSKIPLEVPTRPTDEPFIREATRNDFTRGFNDDLDRWYTAGEISWVEFNSFVEHHAYQFGIRLAATDFLESQPDISPASLLAFLGGPHDDPINFSVYAALRDFPPENGPFSDDSFVYLGTATTAPPIPEPGTVALVGAGLVGLVARRRLSRIK